MVFPVQCGFYLRGSWADGKKSACFPERSPTSCCGRNLFCILYVKHGVRLERADLVRMRSRLLQYRKPRLPAGEASARILCGGLVRRRKKGNFSECVWNSLALGCGGRKLRRETSILQPVCYYRERKSQTAGGSMNTVDFTDM